MPVLWFPIVINILSAIHMEAKLKEYRALRRRKELLDSAKDKIVKSKDKFINFIIPKIFRDMARKEEEVLLV